MSNKTYIGISVAILVIGGYFLYKTKFWNEKIANFTKEEAVAYIVKQGKHSDPNVISTFEESFLKEWTLAILDKKPTFSYNGKLYNTQGGKSLKN